MADKKPVAVELGAADDDGTTDAPAAKTAGGSASVLGAVLNTSRLIVACDTVCDAVVVVVWSFRLTCEIASANAPTPEAGGTTAAAAAADTVEEDRSPALEYGRRDAATADGREEGYAGRAVTGAAAAVVGSADKIAASSACAPCDAAAAVDVAAAPLLAL